MTKQSIQRSRNFTRSVGGRISIGLFLLAGLNFIGQPLTAQSLTEPPASTSNDSSIAQAQTTDQLGLKQVVKIIVEPGTNRIMLVGSKEDVAVVVRTLQSIKERMNSIADPTVTEKVVLKSQMAETVASIMEASIGVHNPGGPEVKINPVHFPEAILISGPASAVNRAKKLLATIDRYEGLSNSDAPAQNRIY